MGQFKDYMDLDEHPFTGLRKLSMPFKARIKNTEYIRQFFQDYWLGIRIDFLDTEHRPLAFPAAYRQGARQHQSAGDRGACQWHDEP